MKNKKLTAITLMLASAVVSAGLGGAVLAKNAVAADEALSYVLTDVFSATDAKIASETIGEGESANKVTAFTINDGGKVTLKRSLALKWYEKAENTVSAKYFTTTFAFKTLDFEEMTFKMESESAWATEDEKATNSVTFTNESGAISVSVNGGGKKPVTITAGQKLTLSLAENTAVDGQFNVLLSDVTDPIGTFENVGANYATYTANEDYPFTFTAKKADGVEASPIVLLYDINGQQFDKLTADDKVVDNAAPVFVVNEDVNGFLLGALFSLDYTVIDVLKSKSLDNDLKYYQYNPALQSGDEGFETYKNLSTSVYFMDTVYYVDGSGNVVDKDAEGATATSVFEKDNRELVAIKLETNDGSVSATYDLAWYASTTETVGNLTYIPVTKNVSGATYKYIEANDTDKENKTVSGKETEYQNAKASFETALAKAAEDVYAGSDSYIYFPSFKWLFDDDNGYRNLKFTISYRSLGSTSDKTSSGLAYNALKLAITEEGAYEFRIFANDKAGNTMKYYVDGEKVEVTTANIWKLENVPTFTFNIENKSLKAEDPSNVANRKDTEILDQTYSIGDIKVVGASNLQSDYKLYKVDLDMYNKSEAAKASEKQLSQNTLSVISYETLAEKVVLTQVTDGKYFDLYLTAYAKALADEIGVTSAEDIAAIKSCFIEIKEYDARITEENAPEEWDAYNKYNWSASSKSFKTAEEGAYLIMADFWDQELATSHRAAAYQVVVVESEADVIPGEDNWLEENVVAVILFSFAGVCGIALIVLLLVKPSDETLEDVDAQADAAAKKAKKKEKQNK